MSKPAFAQNIEINITQTMQQTTSQTVSSTTYSEHITDYTVDVNILDSGKVRVTETIEYDFTDLAYNRHGIYRYIPLTYSLDTAEGTKEYLMSISDPIITDQLGNEYNFTSEITDNVVTYKIGSADTTVSGIQTYVIQYTLSGLLRYFDDHAELYFDAIGTGWIVPITSATITVSHPQSTLQKIRCLYGREGSDTECEGRSLNQQSVRFSAQNLNSYEGLTIVLGIDRDSVAFLPPMELISFWDTTQGKIVVGIFFVLITFWYVVYPVLFVYKWYTFGRDPIQSSAPTAYFDPPTMEYSNTEGEKSHKASHTMPPAIAGALIDEVVDHADILSTLYDLGRRGYLVIKEKDKKVTIVKQHNHNQEEKLLSFEQKFYDSLFATKDTVELKDGVLLQSVIDAKSDIYTLFVDEGYFPQNPNTVRNKYYSLTGLALVTLNLPVFILGILLSKHMPRKTLLGAKVALKAKGLKNFLQSQERQINFKEADPQILFEKLLPYAVAFGVEKDWVKKFDESLLHQPTWYESSTSFSQANMLKSLKYSSSSFAQASVPKYSSTGRGLSSSSSGFSGGGFSGGGGGGGGGGSW